MPGRGVDPGRGTADGRPDRAGLIERPVGAPGPCTSPRDRAEMKPAGSCRMPLGAAFFHTGPAGFGGTDGDRRSRDE